MGSERPSVSMFVQHAQGVIAVLCIALSVPGDGALYAAAQTASTSASSAQSNPSQASAKVANEELDSLVAPIALYPDSLLGQTLVASTYPLEIIQLQQWLAKNPKLKGKGLSDAVMKQSWDPSIQAMASLPDVAKRLAENIKWTTDLGNAFLAQQGDVMDAVQRMRKKAQGKGTLKSSEQQIVESKVIEKKEVIVIETSKPDVVYVPSYNPVVVYGDPFYPYPPIYYPPAGYYAAGMALSFGVGIAMGAAWGGGSGWGCGWGGNNNVYVNHNNNFVKNSNRQNYQGGNRQNVQGGRDNWQHNPQHRGGAPYGDRSTANRFGGTARGDSAAARQSSARQNVARSNTMDRGGGGGLSGRDPGASRGGGDRIGNRDVSGAGGRSKDAFGGAGGLSGSSARASSQRGTSSMRSTGGGSGGGRRGGGGGGRRR